jgi:large subunit ribosomal protein L22
MKYSFNQNKDGVVFANIKDINASYKDLGAVCDAIRYKPVSLAIDTLDLTINDRKPILYRKHNINMGARHELGGKKGRTPIKCAKVVRKVLVNAAANAENKGLVTDALYVVHAAANKTMIARRFPSKGALYVTGGPSGQVPARHSDLEFTRVEIGVAMMDEKKLSKTLVEHIKFTMKHTPKLQKKKEVKKPDKKTEEKKKPLVKIQKQETKPVEPVKEQEAHQQQHETKKEDQEKHASEKKEEPPKELTPKEKTEEKKDEKPKITEQAKQ